MKALTGVPSRRHGRQRGRYWRIRMGARTVLRQRYAVRHWEIAGVLGAARLGLQRPRKQLPRRNCWISW